MKYYLTAILIGFFYYTSFCQTQSSIGYFTNEPVASILHCDTALLNNYKAVLVNDTFSYDREFIQCLSAIIKKFDGKKLDTTIITAVNLDGKSKSCKGVSRIYLYDTIVFVDSWLIRKHDTLWKYRQVNPYLSVGFHSHRPDLFRWDKRSPWVTFAIGVYRGIPTFESYKKYEYIYKIDSGGFSDWEAGLSVKELKEKGIELSTQQWEMYLKKFKGDLFNYGSPETHGCGLLVWYEPCKCFITYYAP